MSVEVSSSVPPHEGSARERRHQAKSQQILDAAAEVFLEEGFSAASVDKIVERAGVSKRTIYQRYRSKEQIFNDIIKTQYAQLFGDEDDFGYLSNDLEVNLRNIGYSMLRMSNNRVSVSLFRAVSAESQRFPDLAKSYFEDLFERAIDAIARALEKDRNFGRPGGCDSRVAAEFFLDVLTGTAFHRVVFGTSSPMGEAAIEKQVERALSYFLVAYEIEGTKRIRDLNP